MSALSIWRNGLRAPLVVIILHYIAGGIFGHEPYVDPIMHFSGGAAAVGWEIAEFASDVFLGTNIQRDVGNTMRDLILGLLGAGLLVAGRLIHPRSSPWRQS